MNPSIKLCVDVLARFLTVLVGGWLTKKGFSEEDATFITGGLALLLGTLIYSLVRNFALRNQEPPAKQPAAGSGQWPDGSWIKLIGFLVLSPALLVMVSGCSTPAKRYAAAMVALDGANQAFISAANAKLLTDRQIVQAEPLFRAADNQVQILQDEFESTGTVNETALKSLVNVIDAIEEWLIKVRARK